MIEEIAQNIEKAINKRPPISNILLKSFFLIISRFSLSSFCEYSYVKGNSKLVS